jgi:cation-transporting ATPase 13A2
VCVIIQLVGFEIVRRQKFYVPPFVDPEHSQSTNSENTTLFLVSCYQYILSAIVLSVGKPFRKSMADNLPFVITMVVALLLSTYMLFDPADWLFDLMDLTDMPNAFKGFLLALGIGYFACAYTSEQLVFPQRATLVGETRKRMFPKSQKKRKEYKIIMESMRF